MARNRGTDEEAHRGQRDVLGGLMVALGAALFGSVVVLGRTDTVRAVPVTSLLAVRFGVAAIILAAVLLVLRQPLIPAAGERLRLVVLGVLGYGVESGLFFLALGQGTAATVTLLFYTYPVWVAVLAAVLGLGAPGLLVGISLAAAVAGSGIVVAASGGLDITAAGIGLALASAVTISWFLVGLEVWVRRTPPLVSSMWVAAAASLGHGAVALATGGRFPADADAWLAVVAMGTLTSGAFMLLFLGVRRLGAVRASIVASLEPVMAALLALAFLGESLRLGVIAGGALILAGAVTASLARARPEPEAGP